MLRMAFPYPDFQAPFVVKEADEVGVPELGISYSYYQLSDSTM